jgi:murein DD-endopeptidase MepM/ murein hydrolase activator NlpD
MNIDKLRKLTSTDFVNLVEDEFDVETLQLMNKVINDRIHFIKTMTNISQDKKEVGFLSNHGLKEIYSNLFEDEMTEKIIKIIQQNSANGGFTLDGDLQANPLMRGKVAEELSTNRSLREVLYALPNRMPVTNFSLSSDFGIRKHPLTGKSHFHTGVDMMSETGDDKVFAVKPGIVVMSELHPQYGNTVVLRHSNGVESLYAHMAQLLVKVGDKVTTDNVLGYIGNTGLSTGKHLHFEILVGGYPVNPQKVIRTAQYVQQIQNKQP